MKIGLVVPGGVDRSGRYRVIPCLLWLIERFARQHEVHVVALYQEPTPSRYELHGATVHNIGIGATRWRALRRIVDENRAASFDVLHAFWAMPPGVIAACAGWLLRCPVVLHLGGGELIAMADIGYGGRRTLRGRTQVRVAFMGAERVTAASTIMVERAASFGIEAEHIPLGVDLRSWPVLEPRQRTGPARLLHVGSLNRVKDQRTLLEAVALLAAAHVEFHMDIVGEDTLSGEMQGLARSLDIHQYITFHGFLPHSRLRDFFDAAHLLVVSSRHEAGPLVFLEAAIAGVPTVGTAVGHVRDFAPGAAVAVPIGDAGELARQIADLLGDEDRRVSLARAAQQRAVREDADWTARRFEEIYRELIDAR